MKSQLIILRALAIVVAAVAFVSGAAFGAVGVNEDCIDNGIGTYAAGNGHVTVTGGQVSGAGATLFAPFFRAPSAYNDWNDVDNDGLAGNFAQFPFVDNLATLWPPNGTITAHWMFQYRSVGSVNGFNEFVESQTCNAIPLSIPGEGGLFNQFEYATGGLTTWGGPFANSSGTPVQPCEIEFSFLDVPSAWAVQVEANGLCLPGGTSSCITDRDCADNEKCVGAAKWNAEPRSPGYGLNPIRSNTGYVSNLQPLSRECGSCADSGDPCTAQKHCAPGQCTISGANCRDDLNCPAGHCSITTVNACRGDAACPAGETCLDIQTCDNLEACDLGGTVKSLNTNTAAPDEDTMFDFVGAWVPVSYIANRGTGLENVKFSEMQYLFTTGRMPNGENLVAATRSVGSGTRNAIMNSTGIDTSWGRGDNVGNENAVTGDFSVGPNKQQTNAEGSSNMEGSVRERRLAVGYTGLAGSGRSASDALAGFYEILNVCKDVDTDGNPLCDCTAQACPEGPKFCSISTDIPCTTNSECNPTNVNGTCVPIDAATPNNGYVRPTISTVLDNCDVCCGYQIGGNGSFVVRGNRHANRDPLDPRFIPGNALDNQAVADFLNNIEDSTNSFEGNVFAGECNTTRSCSVATATDCNEDSDCPGGEICTGALKVCSNNSACTQKTCSATAAGCDGDGDCPDQSQTCIGGPGGQCSITSNPCDIDGDCADAIQVCRNDFCKSSLNMPGQFLATTFFLGAGIDCQQSLSDGMEFSPFPDLNQTLQNYIRDNNGLGIGGDTPAFGSVNPATGGRNPIRVSISGGATYTDGSTTGSVTYWNGSSFITNFASGDQLAARNRIQGDFNEDGVRNISDASELVKAYYLPRTWQRTDPQATGTGSAGAQTTGGSVDNAIPEVMGDFDGNGDFNKEDLRYFMDGLAMNNGQLDRKQGAIDIDTALATYGRCNGDNQVVCRIGLDSDCTNHGTTGPCAAGGTYPWADPAVQLAIPAGLGLDPKFALPKEVDDAGSPFLATGKAYEPGDFRGDVAGRAPAAGAQPLGWDGFVDDKDIDYCCRIARLGSWHDLNDAVFMDLSCDMNGDVEVDAADVTELIEVILGTMPGDVNLDGVVDQTDTDIITASIDDPNPCNANGSCGWADGDVNCDGLVNSTDLGGSAPPAVQPDPSGLNKSRFISFIVPPAQIAGASGETAIRVTLVSLHHVDPPYTAGASTPFTAFEGETLWAGPPAVFQESVSSGVRFVASQLQCDPYYRDWSSYTSCSNALQLCSGDGDCPGGTCNAVVDNLLHVMGTAIVPSSTYTFENLAAACQGSEDICAFASGAAAISTTRWGDVVDPYNPPSATSQPDFGDIGALVNKFKSALGAPIKARALLAGTNARGTIELSVDVGFTHISADVDAFKGFPYPFKPGECMGNAAAACGSDADCTAQSATGPCILCP